MTQRHEGPWPVDPDAPLTCDICDRAIYRGDPFRAFWNPYGWCGWTVHCGACDQVDAELAPARLLQLQENTSRAEA